MVPVFFPAILYRLTPAGTPLFPEFAAMIKPTEFATGRIFGSGTMAPIDYMVGLADGRIPPPKNLNIRFPPPAYAPLPPRS
jgi:amidase